MNAKPSQTEQITLRQYTELDYHRLDTLRQIELLLNHNHNRLERIELLGLYDNIVSELNNKRR